jgi:RimJ/RimL family protein N-acetyltransferase
MPHLTTTVVVGSAALRPLNRFAEKAGFTREGVLRAQRFNARLRRRVDFVMWSLLREEL